MDERIEDGMAEILNLCESNPDAGLEFIERTIRNKPETGSNPFGKFAKAMAYGSKGLFQLSRSRPGVDFYGFDQQDLRDVLGVTDSHVDCLEKGLQEIRDMEAIHPGALRLFGTGEDKMGERKVDAMAIVLERCRPGRVQAILTRTKLKYFGPRRILYPSDLNSDFPEWTLSREDFEVFGDIFFSHPSIVRTAILTGQGTDSEGRKYLNCKLYEKTRDNPAPGETIGETLRFKGGLYFFDDGTFGNTLPEEHEERKKEESHRPNGKEQLKMESMKPGKPVSKQCIRCHSSIPLDALYCTKCGVKQL